MTTHLSRARRSASIARLVAFVLFGLAPGLRAQAPLNGGSSTIAWPAAVTGAPTRSIAGEFTGDHVTDAVFLTTGGGATLVYGPGVYSAFVPLPSDVRDVARLPGSPGHADRLLVLGDAGLRQLSNYDAGAFTATPVATNTAWSTASRLVVGYADADGLLDAVGLAADGRTILVARSVGAGTPVLSSFALPSDVLDLRVVAWSPQPAIVVLTSAGIQVRRWNGAFVVDYVGGTFASGALVGFAQSGLAHERVAVVYTVPGSGDFLGVVDKNGPVQITPLGTIGAYALASGDVDMDGLGDLVVLQRVNHFALLLRNQGGLGAPFGTGDWIDLGLGSQAAPTQSGFPLLADWTNDGDLDLLVHVDATDALVTIENSTRSHQGLAPLVTAGGYAYSFSVDEGELHLDVDPSFTSHPFVPDGIEMTVWAQAGAETSATALVHGVFGFDGQGQAHPTFTVSEPDVATSKIYHIAMRCVRLSGGATLEAGPTAVCSFATPAEAVAALELASGTEGIPLRIFLIDEQRYMTDAEAEERVLTPSGVPLPKIPPIDEPPDPFDP